MADKFAFVRSMVGCDGRHDSYQCMTGLKKDMRTADFWPAMGAWVSKVQGPADPAVPPHMTLMYPTGNATWGYPGVGGFAGMAHAPFRVVGGQGENLKADNLTLKNLTLDQLGDRMHLRTAFDELSRNMDQTGVLDGMDAYAHQAVEILTSPKLRDALDLSKEDPQVLARYGTDDPAFIRDGAAHGANFLPGPAAGGGRRASGFDELQPLGLARQGRQEFRRGPQGYAAAGPGRIRSGYGFARTRVE